MVLPKTAEAASAIAAAGLLEDKDLHTRLAALLVMADAPATPELGRLLYKVSPKRQYTTIAVSREMFMPPPPASPRVLAEYKPIPRRYRTDRCRSRCRSPTSPTGGRPMAPALSPTGRRAGYRNWETLGLEDSTAWCG